MNALARLLIRRIAAQGPITLADYMADALMHPEHGYYATRDPFGLAGDFTTAPEISQMFGEILGLALAQSWLDQGAPSPFTLAELGPGRGTLMADVLRASRAVPGFHQAARVFLVESSAHLRAVQRRALSPYPVTWLDHAADLPQAPLLLLANEFFDALPIRQFQRDPAGWRERLVGVTGPPSPDCRLGFGLGPAARFGPLDHRLAEILPGEIVETCPQAPAIMHAISARIAEHGGAALIVDYGGWQSRGDTFQALRHHRFADPFDNPGAADLTAHVDFAALASASTAPTSFACQGDFLRRLGLAARAERLAEGMTGAALASHLAATRRLTAPEEMGTLFKVLAVHPPDRVPPGMT